MGWVTLTDVALWGPWAIGLTLGIPVVGKIIVVVVALRGSEPKDRPNIIKAVAELFRWRKP